MNFQFTLISVSHAGGHTSPVKSRRRVPLSEKERVNGLVSLHLKDVVTELRTKCNGSKHLCLNSRCPTQVIICRRFIPLSLASVTALYLCETAIAMFFDLLRSEATAGSLGRSLKTPPLNSMRCQSLASVKEDCIEHTKSLSSSKLEVLTRKRERGFTMKCQSFQDSSHLFLKPLTVLALRISSILSLDPS